MKKYISVIVLILTAFIVSCGGGSGLPPSDPTLSDIAGTYSLIFDDSTLKVYDEGTPDKIIERENVESIIEITGDGVFWIFGFSEEECQDVSYDGKTLYLIDESENKWMDQFGSGLIIVQSKNEFWISIKPGAITGEFHGKLVERCEIEFGENSTATSQINGTFTKR